jgi:hypothetical protein
MGTDHLEFLARLWRHRHHPRVHYEIRIDIWRPLWHHHHHHHHHHHEERFDMSTNPTPITQLTTPGAYFILLSLLANGAPYVPEAGSSYVFAPSLTASDTTVQIVADPTVPNQYDVTIPAGDPNVATPVTFTANGTDPDGNALVETLTLPFTSVSTVYTISIGITGAPTPTPAS